MKIRDRRLIAATGWCGTRLVRLLSASLRFDHRSVGPAPIDPLAAAPAERFLYALWHENFLGWPYISSAPVRKDHITDWITANTSKGVNLQSYSIEQLTIRVTGDIAINHYRIKMNWATSETAKVQTEALRITHTWIRTRGTWQILGGMSAPVNGKGQ